MTRTDNKAVADFFKASSRDVTPGSLRQSVRVLYAPFANNHNISERCASVLSASERNRADRFTDEFERALFQQRRAFRRYCAAIAIGSSHPLSRFEFSETPKGRPYLAVLPGYWFSYSSCRYGFLGACSSTHGVGIDLEDPGRNLDILELAGRFYTRAEAAAVERAEDQERRDTFFGLWNLKESALKSVGEGLPFGLDAFEFKLTPEPRLVQAPPEIGGTDRFSSHPVTGTDGCAALIIRERA